MSSLIVFFGFIVLLMLIVSYKNYEYVPSYVQDEFDNYKIRKIHDKIIFYDEFPLEEEMDEVKEYMNFPNLYKKYYERTGRKFNNLDFVRKYLSYNKFRNGYAHQYDKKIDDFYYIAIYCELDDVFIQEYINKLNIKNLIRCQELSEEIILNNFDYFYHYYDSLLKYQKIDDLFKNKLIKLGKLM